jgi:hypothetical protein
LNGSLRSEAQDLAKLLRTSLGEDVLVPTANPAARKSAPAPAPAKKAAATPTRNQTNNSDPFGGLK